jgi:hypothetical protein
MDAVNAASFWKPQARLWISVWGRARRRTQLEGSLKPGREVEKEKAKPAGSNGEPGAPGRTPWFVLMGCLFACAQAD